MTDPLRDHIARLGETELRAALYALLDRHDRHLRPDRAPAHTHFGYRLAVGNATGYVPACPTGECAWFHHPLTQPHHADGCPGPWDHPVACEEWVGATEAQREGMWGA